VNHSSRDTTLSDTFRSLTRSALISLLFMVLTSPSISSISVSNWCLV